MLNSTDKIIKYKTGLLNLAEELGNVSKACKVMDMLCDTFYRYKSVVEDGGVEALFEHTRRKPNLANREDQATEQGTIMTEAQVQALEKKQLDDETYGEIETAHPGYLGSQDTFYVGSLREPRLKRFCRRGKGGSLSPLAQVFRDGVTPDFKLLQAELGARHTFREAARILETFLPCARQHNTTVRNRLGKVAKAIADKTTPVYESQKSRPLTVFKDGAYVRCRPEH